MADDVIIARGLLKSFGKTVVADGIDLTVPGGSILAGQERCGVWQDFPRFIFVSPL
jgi:ABC-type sugar transport system ATPase subunit